MIKVTLFMKGDFVDEKLLCDEKVTMSMKRDFVDKKRLC